MHEMRTHAVIRQLQKQWTIKSGFSYALYSIGASAIVWALLACFGKPSWIWIPVLSLLAFVAMWLLLYKRITEKDVSSFLNRALPDMQESTHLLLKDPAELNFLEKLQVQKISNALDNNISEPKNIRQRLLYSLLLLVAGMLAIVLVGQFPVSLHPGISSKPVARAEIKPAAVAQATLTIEPPAYTGKQKRSQEEFNVSPEEDALLVWNITTTKPVKEVTLAFNDKSVLRLSSDNNYTQWHAEKKIRSAGFYQVRIDSVSSELYRVDMVHDQYPVIDIKTPKPNTLIELGHTPQSQLELSLQDDYGIKATSISATIASGNGEAVKFKKQELLFSDFQAGNKQYQLRKLIDLGALGMKAGDELYFYINATDTRGQEKRSDIYIVRMEDNAQLLSIDPIVNALDIKPELFRSQRQIIIETEQLLKDKDTIRLEDFKKRSNNLGIDQNLLRLRYGKFLGEETNAEIGHESEHAQHSTNEASSVGNAQEMIDEISHKHDNAEDASFFDAETKKQLKATLDEMWKAELQLRIFQPKNALPFEYKALKLLKELQQQTRVYVAKTGSKMPPLKPEKRLTGELDKITAPVTEQTIQNTDQLIVQRKALGVLEQLRNQEPLSPASADILEKAGIQVGNKAAELPALYLAGFESFRKVLTGKYQPSDLNAATAVLQKMLKAAAKTPSQKVSGADKKLSQQYFMNLHAANE